MPFAHDPAGPRPQSRTNTMGAYTKAICAVALALRLLVVFAVWHAMPAGWFYSQASELGEVADSIATGHGIASPFGGGTGPSAFLPPGYPLFVSAAFRGFGAYSRDAELTILLSQACFGAAAVLLSMLIARRLFGRTTATATGIILAIDPWLIALGFVFWETSCSLMLLLALVWLALCWKRKPSSVVACTAAVLGALAILINASLALTCITLFAWAVYNQQRHRKKALLPAVLFLLLMSIWPLRNEVMMHSFIPLRDNLGYELWQGNRPGADGFFAPELHPNTNLVEFERFQELGELNYMHEKSGIALAAISAQPGRFLYLTGKRVLCFWLGINRQTYPNQIAVASLTSLLGLAGLGLYLGRRALRPILPLLIPLVLFPGPYYITHPDFRFWCMLSPLLTAFAVYLFTHRMDDARTSETFTSASKLQK